MAKKFLLASLKGKTEVLASALGTTGKFCSCTGSDTKSVKNIIVLLSSAVNMRKSKDEQATLMMVADAHPPLLQPS